MSPNVPNGGGKKKGNEKRKPKQMLFNFGSDAKGIEANRVVRAKVASEMKAKAVAAKFTALRDALTFTEEMHNAENARRLKQFSADFRARLGKDPQKSAREFISWLEARKRDSERAASNALRVADNKGQAEGHTRTAEFIGRYISYLKTHKTKPF